MSDKIDYLYCAGEENEVWWGGDMKIQQHCLMKGF